MEIVQMNSTHISQVAELEKACFSTAWSENSIERELHNPLSLWLVAVEGDRVVGYVGSQSVMDEADMMNIAVHQDYRRLGIASKLVCELIEKLHLSQVHCLTLEVRLSNESAQAMYDKLGFVQIGRRPNYYTLPKEDALILRKEWEI